MRRLEPAKDQRGPNLSQHEIIHLAGRRVQHVRCGGEMIQVLWQGKDVPPYSTKLMPLSTPGTIFCSKCGYRAGKRITRLLKTRDGIEDVFVHGSNQLLTSEFNERHRDENDRGDMVYTALRSWVWKIAPDHPEDLPELAPRTGNRPFELDSGAINRLRDAFSTIQQGPRHPARRTGGTVSGRVVVNIPPTRVVSGPLEGGPFAGTNIMMDGNKFVLRYPRGNGTCFYLILNRFYWGKASTFQVRDALPVTPLTSLEDLTQRMRTLCRELNKPDGPTSFLVTENENTAVSQKFPPFMAPADEDVPF